jgi:hypothetical protein
MFPWDFPPVNNLGSAGSEDVDTGCCIVDLMRCSPVKEFVGRLGDERGLDFDPSAGPEGLICYCVDII